MNQSELIDAIAADPQNTGISKASIKFVLDAQARTAHQVLASGSEVTLPGLGKLSVKVRAARTGRNPRTGAEVQIPAKKAPHFSASKVLKDALV